MWWCACMCVGVWKYVVDTWCLPSISQLIFWCRVPQSSPIKLTLLANLLLGFPDCLQSCEYKQTDLPTRHLCGSTGSTQSLAYMTNTNAEISTAHILLLVDTKNDFLLKFLYSPKYLICFIFIKTVICTHILFSCSPTSFVVK